MYKQKCLLILFSFLSTFAFSQPLATDNLTTSINNGLNATVVGLTFAMNQAVDKLGIILEKQSRATIASLDLNGRIGNLDAILQSDLSNLQKDLENISNEVLIASNSIPFSKKIPQISSIIPENKDNDSVTLTIKGNFVYLRKPQFNAYLVKDKNNIGYAMQKWNNVLVFRISKKKLAYATAKISHNYFNVLIPYNGFLKTKYAIYIIDIETYPSTLGRIDIYEKRTETTRDVKKFVSREIVQASDHDDKKDVLHCETPDDGYTVDKTTISREITWSQGDEGNDQDFWFGDNSNTTPGNACYTLTTIHHRIGTSGKVHFKIKFDEFRNIETTREALFSTTTVTDDFITSIRLPEVISKIRFSQFDGKNYEFDSNLETDFFKLLRNGNYLYVKKK